MGDFDRDLAAVADVGAAKDRRHTAAGHHALDAIVVKQVAGVKWGHGIERGGAKGAAILSKFVRTPAIHSHALNVPDADQLHADIIATVLGNRKSDQLMRGGLEILFLAENLDHVGRR